MINALHAANICVGNFDDRFIDLACIKKGKFFSCNGGGIIAYLDESFCLEVNGLTHGSTIRHANCEILLSDNEVCFHCAKFRNTLCTNMETETSFRCTYHLYIQISDF